MGEVIQFPGRPPQFKMWCSGCGADRTVPSHAADPGPCSCGSTMRQSFKPRLAGIGLPIGFSFTMGGPGIER